MPSLLPAHVHWPGAPQPAQEITGAPRGRPGRPGSEAAREGRRPLSAFVSASPASLGSQRPPGARNASPDHSCPASPSRTPGTGPPGPRLLKGQVQGGDAALSALGVGHPGPALASQGTDRWALGPRLTRSASPMRGPAAGHESLGGKNVSGPEGTTKKPKTTESKEASWTSGTAVWGSTGLLPGGRYPRSRPHCASARLGVQRACGGGGCTCSCVYPRS